MTSKSLHSIILFLFIALPLFFTLPQYGVTFDEPIYLEAAGNVQKWLALPGGQLFNPDTIAHYWQTDPVRNVHPSGVKWLYLIAQKFPLWQGNPFLQNRILGILIFSVCLLVFLNWWKGDNFSAKILYVFLLFMIPRFFAHLHFAATDIPMTALLLLLVVCLDKTLFRATYWLSGVLLGLLVCVKITSVILVIPLFFVFLFWYLEKWRDVVLRILVICFLGIMVFYLLNPDWWFSPISRCREFLGITLTRRSWTPFTLFFGGHFYNYRGPWYYSLVIFTITTPLLHLTALFTGLALLFKHGRRGTPIKTVLLLVGLTTPFLLLILPLSPAHDGIRYLLSAFPFAVCFMAGGLLKVWQYVTRKSQGGKAGVTRCIVAVAALGLFAADIHSPARFPPFELSYYNQLVGGISGAHERGYETTYWWEILNHRALEKINGFCKGASVYFPIPPTDLFFKQMKAQGKIAFEPAQENREQAGYVLIMGRPYVKYWEKKTWPLYRRAGKIPVPVWGIALDSVPLLELYRIKKK
ncbi:hypothetical protein ACFL4N_00245 [Thermodesulfobacteriota bacterium]